MEENETCPYGAWNMTLFDKYLACYPLWIPLNLVISLPFLFAYACSGEQWSLVVWLALLSMLPLHTLAYFYMSALDLDDSPIWDRIWFGTKFYKRRFRERMEKEGEYRELELERKRLWRELADAELHQTIVCRKGSEYDDWSKKEASRRVSAIEERIRETEKEMEELR